MLRKWLKDTHWPLVFAVAGLMLIGWLFVYSASIHDSGNYAAKQPFWILMGLAVLLSVPFLSYRTFLNVSYLLYSISLFLLVWVLAAGEPHLGAQRWISVGPVSFQPSEFFRILFVIGFSAYLSDNGQKVSDKINIKTIMMFAIIPLVLVIKQPDLGTSILLMSLFVILTLAKGISKKLVTLVLVIGLISIPFLGHIFWEGLKDYQKNRIIAFMDPEVDPAGIGYHIAQSKITIGSGGFLGKGYLNGTQGPLRFLPEKHTDFIFSVFAEEWGFWGSLLLLSAYLLLFLRGLDTAIKAKDEFGRLMAVGITSMFFVYFFVNIGMTFGLMPVVGVPLPFVSYGGTALLSNFIAAGILINIRTRRFELFYP